MLKRTCLLIVFTLLWGIVCKAQDSSKLDKAIAFPDKLFSALDKKTSSIEQKLDKQTNRYLSKLQRRENKLRKKLWKKDSTLAKQLYDGADEKYAQLKQLNSSTAKPLSSSATQPLNKYSSVYSGHLDSLTTALNFLKEKNIANNPELQKTLSQYKELQQKLNASDQIKKYLAQRQQLLKGQFEKLGMVRELKQYRKQVYYYQAQVAEYKQAFEDPSKIEAKLMEVVMKLPQFKDFFAKNSMLGSLFALPSSSPVGGSRMGALQTRATVNQSLIDRFGSSSAVTQQLQQNVQSAQGQLNQLKNKVSAYSSGSYGSLTPDPSPGGKGGFTPNTQKTKSLWQRIEYGANIQSQRARYFFPVTSDIALSLGYKINDKSSIGVGASYKLGWGNNWNSIKISHQGVGLRSYIEWQIPSPVGGRRKGAGSFYFSGGYEQNYRPLIGEYITPSFGGSRREVAWQTSGLIGVSKKYQISSPRRGRSGGGLKGEMKLLWDFMSYQQVPKGQAILFRVGYSLK